MAIAKQIVNYACLYQPVYSLFYCYGFGKVAGLIDITAT